VSLSGWTWARRQFLAPVKVYLVPLAIAGEATMQSDPRLTKVGELGRLARSTCPARYGLSSPRLDPGEYTAAVWFKGIATGRWANALAGIGPRLTIREAADVGPAEGPVSHVQPPPPDLEDDQRPLHSLLPVPRDGAVEVVLSRP
jgi:hypothetical protein